jgi:hypothetical protein
MVAVNILPQVPHLIFVTAEHLGVFLLHLIQVGARSEAYGEFRMIPHSVLDLGEPTLLSSGGERDLKEFFREFSDGGLVLL